MSTATIHTNKGAFTVKLMPEHAPETVDNFVGLATGTREWTDPGDGSKKSEPFYAGTIFHRVIPEFMVQGGDPTGTGRGGPGYQFEDEVEGGPSFDRPGLLAMANAGPGTNGSQFFIVTADACPWLDGKHTVFGRITAGQDVADGISQVERDERDRPLEPVVLESVQLT